MIKVCQQPIINIIIIIISHITIATSKFIKLNLYLYFGNDHIFPSPRRL